MKSFIKLFGIIALVAVIGFSMAACGNDGDEKKGGGLPAELIGSWVSDSNESYKVEFKSNNTVAITGMPDGDRPAKASGNKITVTMGPTAGGTNQSFNYAITNGKLVLSQPSMQMEMVVQNSPYSKK